MVIWLNKVYHVMASRRLRLYTTKSDFEFSMGLHSIFIKFNGFKTVFVFIFFLYKSFSFQGKSIDREEKGMEIDLKIYK